MTRPKRRVVLSLEQALSMPHATLRFVQKGWRVIRIEPTPTGANLPGDPNRYIGKRIAEEDRRSYFIAQNVGKEAIALNLKDPEGQALLRRIIGELDVDVFCCNTIPKRYRQLGIDYDTLRSAKPDLIWVGISAMGPQYPEVPGYDPAMQALVGFMELTGEPDGPPMLSGVPLIDLKAGDDAYGEVMAALLERTESGEGKAIHISMLQAAASWLVTTLPLLNFDCDPSEVGRAGNEHRKFVPSNAYPTSDGRLFVSIGNDLQWQRLTSIPGFAGIANEARKHNEGRIAERVQIHLDIAELTRTRTTAELAEALQRASIPHAPIQTIEEVARMDALAHKFMTSAMPDGSIVKLQPPSVDIDRSLHFSFPPRYAEQTAKVLSEIGLSQMQTRDLEARGVIALGS